MDVGGSPRIGRDVEGMVEVILLERQILTKEEAGGRSTSDRLQLPKWPI